ncbi:uncharacterized protein LOC110239119 isoform X2 [Exaiptasia diaphana]|uniref:Integrase core domain-containing protein n=1 Tax=Exaiptasia diaphana TaxID=2652724 RepID=A0A913X852_EXADI|nr:uncharacterized protein LOC110239119 isoform X2 [Exaiptasia diaphana]
MNLEEIVEETFVKELIEKKLSYKEISKRIQRLFPGERGISARSVRRYCSERGLNPKSLRWVSDGDIKGMIEANVKQYGHFYGRRMMQGTLRYQLNTNSQQYHEISQRRIAKVLQEVAPYAYEKRTLDLLDRTNPIPYHAPYFGYKVHMDQNEKLAQSFGVTHIHALDGCSRMVLGFLSIPKKNPILIYKYLFRPLLLQYGLFEQLRVDHGTEFCLCIFVQELLKNYRYDQRREPWKQTTSTRNYRAERMWPEENQRVNYPLKRALCLLLEQDMVNMEDPLTVFAVSWVTIHVSKVGSENMINSWNYHRIPGPKGCVPVEKMKESNKAVCLPQHLIPTTSEVVRMYEERGGQLNTDPSIGYDPIVHFQEAFIVSHITQFNNYLYQCFSLRGCFRSFLYTL